MNCVECHRALPEMIEGPRSAELNAHLASCAECSALVAELNAISREARLLQAVEEPSPRVWNMIEAQLRSEGLIHPPQPRQTWGMLPGTGWRPFVWMAPVAAALIAGALATGGRLDTSPQADGVPWQAPTSCGCRDRPQG